MEKYYHNYKNPIMIHLIMRGSCHKCETVSMTLKSFQSQNLDVKLQIFDLEKGDNLPEKAQPFITPAVWVNGILWYLGSFNQQAFIQKLENLDLEEKLPINPPRNSA
ncbi:MAG: thioredoxin family protein [Candidatus Neomarinimicrobiota bacterium]